MLVVDGETLSRVPGLGGIGARQWGVPALEMSSVGQATAYLPVGTVTFLLTDVEGSTLLWESAPEAMGTAIRRHYQLLDAAITLHGGVRPQEQGGGDSVVAAFARASDALAAALDIQRAFTAECWPQGARLTLRIALHTAQAQLRDEVNYFGPGVNCCARLRALAHGGQVVLSETTRGCPASGPGTGHEPALRRGRRGPGQPRSGAP